MWQGTQKPICPLSRANFDWEEEVVVVSGVSKMEKNEAQKRETGFTLGHLKTTECKSECRE